jgi:hypothetical protein
MIPAATLTTIVLVAALVVVALPALRAPAGRLGAGIERLFGALQPDFTHFTNQRATTQTFHMLVSAIVMFGILLTLWAGAAGVMRTLWLDVGPANGVPDPVKTLVVGSKFCSGGCRGLWLALIVEILRAVGAVLSIGAAAGLVGALLGFIFGIPRPISANESPPAAAGGAVPAGGARKQAIKAWELSTNLTQVSDWLTKIIVGVGLVEAKNGASAFVEMSDQAANWLFAMRHGSPTLIMAAILGSGVFGFLFAYLYTQLIVARLIAAADYDLGQIGGEASATLGQMSSWDEGLVERISRSAYVPDSIPTPSARQIGAALSINQIPFRELIARPDVTAEDVRSWGRAKAVLNDYESAQKAYVYLLGTMSP